MKFQDFMNGQFVGYCVVRKASLAKTNAGKPYANLQVYDGTDQIMGRIWDCDGPIPGEGTVIKIDGVVSEYNGSPQVTISRWRSADSTEYDPAQFMPVYDGDRTDLVHNLLRYIKGIEDASLQLLVQEIVTEKYPQEFYDAPAAVTHHHNYLGGLLEHTVSVTTIAAFLADSQRQPINRDLVIAGAILHDIGKMKAYDWSGCTIERSADGKLIDHIPLGVMMLKPYLDEFADTDLAQHLLHIIVSHHGIKEWGSPVEPATQEAKIIHLADLADSRLNASK